MIFAPSPRHRHPYRTDETVGPYDSHDTPGVHRAGRHSHADSLFEVSRAHCPHEMRASLDTPGDGMGRTLRHCRSKVCPKHQPEAYARCWAKHDPDSLRLPHGGTR